MTIKQQGGIFGRNPTFNDLTVEGTLTTSGTQTVDALNVTNNLDVDGVITTDGLTVNATTTTLEGSADQILQLRTTNSSADNRIYFGRTGEDTRGIIYFQHNGGKLRYDVDSNHIFTVTNASGLAMQRNVSFTAGNGIDFSATSGTGTSELFDDYEEGTWTPTFTSTSASFSYTNQFGSYVKIGGFVSAQFYLNATASGTTSNQVTLSGLPFASANLNAFAQSAGSVWFTGTANVTPLVSNNAATAVIWKNNTAASNLNAVDVSGHYFVGTVFYRAS